MLSLTDNDQISNGMQERYGNYWKRRGIVCRERTLLQAAFTPYLPPPASSLPASLTYRLAKPHWGSRIIHVIKFILANGIWPFVEMIFLHLQVSRRHYERGLKIAVAITGGDIQRVHQQSGECHRDIQAMEL